MGEGAGLVAVVQRHEVAADAGGGEAALGQARRRAVRAAGAEGGNAAQQAGRTLRHARRRRVLDVQAGGSQEAGETGGDDFRRQFHQRRQQRRAGCVGLAADLRARARPAGCRARRESALSTKLRFSSITRIARLPRANSRRPSVSSGQVMRDLVERDLRVVLEAQHAQRVQRVVVRAADGDQADRRVTACRRCAGRAGWRAPRQAPRAGAPSTTRRSSSARSAGKRRCGSKFSPCGGSGIVGRDEVPGGRDDQRVAACSAVSAVVFSATHRPQKRDSAIAGEAEIDDVLRPRPGSAPA